MWMEKRGWALGYVPEVEDKAEVSLKHKHLFTVM